MLVATLNRPEKKNALTGAMYRALREALVAASADEGVGAVLLTGAGGAFCAGNDIGDFLAESRAQSEGARSGPGGEFIRTLARFDKPLVAAVEGPAVGVGTTMCLHCDLVYAAPSARFAMPFVNLGLVPEAGSSMLVPRRFGLGVASELLLLGETIDGRPRAGDRPRRRGRRAGGAEGPCARQGQGAGGQAPRGAAGHPQADARRRRGAVRAYGGRARRLRPRAEIAGGARGLRGVREPAEGLSRISEKWMPVFGRKSC